MKMKVCICLLFFSLLLVGCDGRASCPDCYPMAAGDVLEVSCIDESASIGVDVTNGIASVWCE